MKMILSFLIIYFTSYVVQAEFNDSNNDKYIEMLPENEKEDFISNVARRIADEVLPQFEPVGDVLNVSDEQLDTQNEYIKKLLEEERAKMRRRSNINLHLNRKEDADIVVTTIHNANRRKRDLFTTKSSAAHLENNDYDVIPVKSIYDSAHEDSDRDILARNIKIATTEIAMQTSQNDDKAEIVDLQPENNEKEESKSQDSEKSITNSQNNYENADEIIKIPITDISANTEAVNARPITETPVYDDTVTVNSINETRKENSTYGDNFSNKNRKSLTEHLNENQSISSATLSIETISNNTTEVANVEKSEDASETPALNYSVDNDRSKYAAKTTEPNNSKKDLDINLNGSTTINKTETPQPVFKGYFEPGSNTYEVREMPPNQIPFIPIKKKDQFTAEPIKIDNKQYHYVPVYNYGLHNAVFESKHRFNSAEREDNDKDKDNKDIDLDYYYMHFKNDHPVQNGDKVEGEKPDKIHKKQLEMDYYFNRDNPDFNYDVDGKEAQAPSPLFFGNSLKENFKTVREKLKLLKNINTMDGADNMEAAVSNDESIFREHSDQNEETEETSVRDDDVTDVNSLLTVVEDMINFGNSALSRYDWLGTTVYIQTALQKLSQVIDTIKDGYDIHPEDWDLFKYIVYIYGKCKLKREKIEENSYHMEIGKELKGKANNFVVLVLPRREKNKSKESMNKIEEILGDFEDFLFDLYNSVKDLHKSMKNISPKIKFKNQNWFANLRESYLRNPTKQQILSLLIHLFTIDLLDTIEEISLKNSKGNYVDVIKGNGEEVKKTEEIFNVLLSFLEKLKK